VGSITKGILRTHWSPRDRDPGGPMQEVPFLGLGRDFIDDKTYAQEGVCSLEKETGTIRKGRRHGGTPYYGLYEAPKGFLAE